MHRPCFQREAVRSLSRLASSSGQGRPHALFSRSPRVRAQQERTFRWTGESGLRQSAQVQAELHDETSVDFAPSDLRTGFGGSVVKSRDRDEQEWEEDEKEESGFKQNKPVFDEGEACTSVNDAQNAVSRALTSKAPPQDVLFVFLRAARCPGYLSTLNEPYLKSVMDVIRPRELLLPFRVIHRELHPAVLRYHRHRSLADIFAAYTNIAELVLAQDEAKLGPNGKPTKRASRWKLRILLEIAAVTGNGRQAQRTFETLKSTSKYRPSLESYNQLLQAVCWSGAYLTEERYGLRVTPKSLERRSAELLGKGRGESHRYQTGKGGIKDQALSVVRQMRDGGIKPDAETWANVVIALAREGDVDGVKATVQSIWDVDIDAVLQRNESSLLFENQLSPEAATYPNENTLHAIAHALCINNDVAAALQTVDFLSRKYDVPIDVRTWEEIMEWTYVLSKHRYGRDIERKEDSKIGQLPVSAVLRLWKIMSSPPYDVSLNMKIARYLFKSHVRRGAISEALDVMSQAESIAKYSYHVYERARRETHDAKQGKPFTGGLNLTLEMAKTQSLSDEHRITIFLRDLLSSYASRRGRTKPHSRQQNLWHHKTIPDLIGRYSAYESVHGHAYSIPNGRVQFRPPKKQSKERKVILRKGESPVAGMHLWQPPQIWYAEPYTGYTRQVRLQYRHSKRDVVSRRPLYQPQWFEKNDVRVWQPKTKERSKGQKTNHEESLLEDSVS